MGKKLNIPKEHETVPKVSTKKVKPARVETRAVKKVIHDEQGINKKTS
jgi:hypothetical protein